MANPAVLLIKPLIKAIGKAAVKAAGTATAKGATAKVATTAAKTGLGALAKGSISATDAINIARAAVDKKIAPSVAKSLGMTTKELKAVTDKLSMTQARKEAVKGKNYLKNINRFLEKPESSIKSYVKRELRKGVKKQLKPLTDKAQSKLDEAAEKLLETPKQIALRKLEGHLRRGDEKFTFSKQVWDNIDDIDIDVILEILEEIDQDLYYNQNTAWEITMANEQNKGYKMGILWSDYISDIQNRLLADVVGTPIDGII